MLSDKIPENTIKRLPIYLGILEQINKQDQDYIYSYELEEYSDVKHSLVRKDLSYFGEFGERGKGYPVGPLREAIREILGISHFFKNTVVIGCGNIGTALIKYPYFNNIKLKIIAAFDIDPVKIGTKIGTAQIFHVNQLHTIIQQQKIEFVILSIPKLSVKSVLPKLIDIPTIKGIVNFTPIYLQVPPRIKVVDVNISAKFLTMLFYLKT